MKLTTERLKRLIREELEKVMEMDDNASREKSKRTIGQEVQNALSAISDREPAKQKAETNLIAQYANVKDAKEFAKVAHEIFDELYMALEDKPFNYQRFLTFLENNF
jgi:2,3-bisphosphoglycerate-independent phosphoglycerate mutase